MNTLSIYVSDYASYNAGLQFATGKYYDLEDYSEIEELIDDVKTHYRNVLDNDSEVQRLYRVMGIDINSLELMITDAEGGLENFLTDDMNSFNYNLVEKIIDNIEDVSRILNADLEDLLAEFNQYRDEPICVFDEDFFENQCSGNVIDVARSACFGGLNWTDKWIFVDGAGNYESIGDLEVFLDRNELLSKTLKIG